jgi:hypothetical protein
VTCPSIYSCSTCSAIYHRHLTRNGQRFQWNKHRIRSYQLPWQ